MRRVQGEANTKNHTSFHLELRKSGINPSLKTPSNFPPKPERAGENDRNVREGR
jgi:hypothetical protein